MALTEKQQEKVQVCEKVAGVKERFKKNLVRSRPIWAGHLKRMGDGKLANRADAQKMEEKKRRGRPKLRWGIALKVT